MKKTSNQMPGLTEGKCKGDNGTPREKMEPTYLSSRGRESRKRAQEEARRGRKEGLSESRELI